MRIDEKSISSGSCNGRCLWICDLRYNDYSEKPIRNVRPQEVLVRDNAHTRKNVYYSRSHFSVPKKDGTPSAKILALYDNTGFRGRTGVPLNVFTTKEECVDCYKSLAFKALEGLQDHLDRTTAHINSIGADIMKTLENL